MTWNDLQWAKNDLKRPTTSKVQPTTTWSYQQQVKKTWNDQQLADCFKIWGNRFFSLTRFPSNIWLNHSSIASWRIMVKIERQTFVYYHRLQDKHLYITISYRISCGLLWHLYINFCEVKVNLMNQAKKNQILTEIKHSGLWKGFLVFFHLIILKNYWMLLILCLSSPIERFSNLLRLTGWLYGDFHLGLQFQLGITNWKKLQLYEKFQPGLSIFC